MKNTVNVKEVLGITIAEVGTALANDNHWLKPDSEGAKIVKKAVELGWVVKLSHSQYQWKTGVLDGTLYLVDSEEFKGSVQNTTYYKAGAIRASYTEHQPYWEYVREFKEKYDRELILITDAQLEILSDAFMKAHSTDLVEISEEEFDDMYEVLPPLKVGRVDEAFMFMICEATWGPLHSFFAQYKGKCYTGLRSKFSKFSDLVKEVQQYHGANAE